MPLLKGLTLAELIKNSGEPLSIERVADIGLARSAGLPCMRLLGKTISPLHERQVGLGMIRAQGADHLSKKRFHRRSLSAETQNKLPAKKREADAKKNRAGANLHP